MLTLLRDQIALGVVVEDHASLVLVTGRPVSVVLQDHAQRVRPWIVGELLMAPSASTWRSGSFDRP